MMKIEKMDWDTDFWGIPIYNASKENEVTRRELDFDKEFCRTPFIIQALALDSDIEFINFLENNKFRFVESKVNLIKSVQVQSCEFEGFRIRDARIVDFQLYLDDFYELYGEVSRFNFLEKSKVNQFYYQWVTNSINGKMDDNCIGYYDEEILEGFITYKINESNLTIGLVGVFPKYQGKKISHRLLSYINNLAIKNHCDKIYISTQGKNIKAINAYIKSGFIINNIQQWYYLKGGEK